MQHRYRLTASTHRPGSRYCPGPQGVSPDLQSVRRRVRSPAESAYEEWWDGTERGILSGPPASDMKSRYDALDAAVPPEYPADHVSLLLEYASLLLEAEQHEGYANFHEAHFDWIPAFRERVEATSDSGFYLWAVRTLDSVVQAMGERYAE
ncbi:molecular chaperone TorD family protein [Natronoarchaeum sp. GCM10025321]|uniref:molecular chaperone TorD family protein n=1 Tax=Natronoarchaeum sp. GCM10025321 TaxID=3252684 RepID=UPI00360B4D56